MTDSQKESWRYALSNAPKGLLRRLDRSLLAVWVIAEDTHREAMLRVQKFGMLTKTPNGAAIQSPYLSIMNRQAEIMMRSASELGFTPTSRARITLKGTEEEAPGGRFSNNRRPA